MKETAERLNDMFEACGWNGRLVPIARLADLAAAFRNILKGGVLDSKLHRLQLDSFSFDPPPELPDARSLVVIAVPTPQVRTHFCWRGERLPVVVPPTYVSYTPRTKSAQAEVAGWLAREGYRLAKTNLPLKTLAVHCGLAVYGSNNLCFVDGMGSFLQLVGAFTDLPCPEDPWQEPRVLDRCESCIACRNQCPTGAIGRDRFMLHAERCITFHNEGADEFADWIDPSWHHCWIGCMRCQGICPENKSVREWFEDRCEFSEGETTLMIEGAPFDSLPTETATKVLSLEINEDYQVLCRNLRVLLTRKSTTLDVA
jgi:epoxyqueuosine reductase